MSVSEAELQALLATLAPTRPLLVCTICGGALDEVHRDLGTHPSCDPQPLALEKPASTIAELRNILVDFDANSARSRQTEIGPSEIAVPCDRRLGYRIHGTPAKRDGRVPWAPMIGTAVHALIADALAVENVRLERERWLIEQRVHPDPSISGSCDAYDTDQETVVDWKVVGPTRLEHYRRKGPGAQYEGQIQIYGRGWQRAGRSPRWVRIVFLPRSTDFDEAYEWTAPYSRELADGALDRLFRTMVLLKDLGVEGNPAMWGAVPAMPDRYCVWCPYFRRGAAADASGCPGDVAADARRTEKFTEGLIASPTKETASNAS
jgi:hypothetical protein